MTKARFPLLALAAVTLGTGAFAQTDFGFMPDGGKGTLHRLVDAGRLVVPELAARTASEDEWLSVVREADPSLDADAAATLASYLALNMPASLAEEPSVAALPMDGRELAVENCQFCHSFFTGYLVHDRDAEGWRAIFKSPFHAELPMTPVQRETFARYSAINMPVPIDKVPEDLRF